MPGALPHFSHKAGLHEQHIERCAGEQAQKHVPLPPLQRGDVYKRQGVSLGWLLREEATTGGTELGAWLLKAKICLLYTAPRAAETMHTALERSAPWSCARAVLAYRVTLVRGDILSFIPKAGRSICRRGSRSAARRRGIGARAFSCRSRRFFRRKRR